MRAHLISGGVKQGGTGDKERERDRHTKKTNEGRNHHIATEMPANVKTIFQTRVLKSKIHVSENTNGCDGLVYPTPPNTNRASPRTAEAHPARATGEERDEGDGSSSSHMLVVKLNCQTSFKTTTSTIKQKRANKALVNNGYFPPWIR